jgi:hypothetical protein
LYILIILVPDLNSIYMHIARCDWPRFHQLIVSYLFAFKYTSADPEIRWNRAVSRTIVPSTSVSRSADTSEQSRDVSVRCRSESNCDAATLPDRERATSRTAATPTTPGRGDSETREITVVSCSGSVTLFSYLCLLVRLFGRAPAPAAVRSRVGARWSRWTMTPGPGGLGCDRSRSTGWAWRYEAGVAMGFSPAR